MVLRNLDVDVFSDDVVGVLVRQLEPIYRRLKLGVAPYIGANPMEYFHQRPPSLRAVSRLV